MEDTAKRREDHSLSGRRVDPYDIWIATDMMSTHDAAGHEGCGEWLVTVLRVLAGWLAEGAFND